MTQSVRRVMRSQGSGVFVNLITGAGTKVQGEAAFVASMNGLDGFTREAARELSPHGIRVYAVENAGDKIVERVIALLDANDAQTEER